MDPQGSPRPGCCSSPGGSPSRRCGASLEEMTPPFEAEVAVLKITVAALMTTPWIAPLPRGARRAPTWCCFPGCVEGETERS